MAESRASLGLGANTYEFDFFNGAQISVYVGDILIDDIYTIEYQVEQSKRPVYGYASQYYHKAAPGQIMVRGSFAISFKEANYLIATLSRFAEDKAPIDAAAHKAINKGTKNVASSVAQSMGMVGGDLMAEEIDKVYHVKRESIERFLEREKNVREGLGAAGMVGAAGMAGVVPSDLSDVAKNNPVPAAAERYKFYRELAALPDQAFEDAAEVFEDMLWQEPTENFQSSNASTHQDGMTNNYRRADQYPPIDIYIVYGDLSNAAANHTMKKIIDVDIVGEGQQISVDGQVIMEGYSFIAKNVA